MRGKFSLNWLNILEDYALVSIFIKLISLRRKYFSDYPNILKEYALVSLVFLYSQISYLFFGHSYCHNLVFIYSSKLPLRCFISRIFLQEVNISWIDLMFKRLFFSVKIYKVLSEEDSFKSNKYHTPTQMLYLKGYFYERENFIKLT